MTIEILIALILFVGVVAYACFGGADFGVGFWDLTAGDAHDGGAMRSLIDRSIGPVWEANHVWLIFVLVYLWSGFPGAFASIMETLYIPFLFAGLGIVLRGAAFAFRKFAPTVAYARFYGVLFAVSSVVTPFFFGTIAGALASGRVPAAGVGDAWHSWTGPTSIIAGVLAVLTCAFVASVFLTVEAARNNDEKLIRACQQRALAVAVVAGIAAVGALFLLKDDAPLVYDGLRGRALPVVSLSVVAGAATIAALVMNRFKLARVTAPIASASVTLAWGVAQYPYMVAGQITIADGAGASVTLWALFVVFVLAGLTVFPALGYLYWVTQKSQWARDH